MKNPSPVSVRLFCCATALLSLIAAAPLAGLPPDPQEQPVPSPESAAKQTEKKQDSAPPPAFRIDQPGTITFTVGMVIKGKIDKPQVIIFLPKEKLFYRELKFTHSFAGEISEPLPFTPIVE